MKIKLLSLLAIVGLAAPLAHSQVFTYYTLETDTPNRGSFSLEDEGLYNVSQLSRSGSNVFNYAYALFTPAISGTYTFGIQHASYDPAMIVYANQTSFPADPSTNVIGFNDDGGVTSFNGLNFTNSAVNAAWNPIVDNLALTAGETYLVAVTSFGAWDYIPLPITFFAYGQAAVDVGPAVPEPSTYAAIFGAVALGGAFAWRRRQQG